MTTSYLESDLKSDEGCRLTAYQDTLGVWTIGYGHTFWAKSGLVWTQAEAEMVFESDLAAAISALDRNIPWWRLTLSDVRQDVLVNMCFNLGYPHLAGFRRALAAMLAGAWDDAAAEMLDSVWASQYPNRAKRLAHQMQTGVRA